jgi:hypothetical protein
MNIKIVQHKQKLDTLFTQASTITDMKMQGEWAKYLCVLASGYLENSLRILILEYVSKNSSPRIQRFNDPQISNLTNCKHAKIVKVLDQFDVNWSTAYIAEIEAKSKITDEIKDSIDSLVQNRHDIAHGKSVGVGYVSVKKYYEQAHKAVEIIDKIIK